MDRACKHYDASQEVCSLLSDMPDTMDHELLQVLEDCGKFGLAGRAELRLLKLRSRGALPL